MFLSQSKKERFFSNLSFYIIKTSKLIFKVSVITFITYFLLEQFKTGLISNYFDLNILLILAIIMGILLLLFSKENDSVRFKKGPNYIILMILAILLGIFIFQNLQDIGFFSVLISLLSIFAIYTLLSLNLTRYD